MVVSLLIGMCIVVFFKQKTAYEMLISYWSADVCSSDLPIPDCLSLKGPSKISSASFRRATSFQRNSAGNFSICGNSCGERRSCPISLMPWMRSIICAGRKYRCRSEEHTSELQSLMRISYAVFCLKKNTVQHTY